MPAARFNVEGPTNAQWLESTGGATPSRQTGSPSALFRNIQLAILQWMLEQGPDQHYAYPSAAGKSGFIIHPGSQRANVAGAHPFALDGALGADSVTMLRAIALAHNATAVASAALADLSHHRISPATLAWGISLARGGKSITLEPSAVMPGYGALPTGAPRGGVILPDQPTTPTPEPTFAPPGTTPTTTADQTPPPPPPPAPGRPPAPPAPTPGAPPPAPGTTPAPGTPPAPPGHGTTVLASFTEPTPAPTSWASNVPTWVWWAGGTVLLVGGGLAVAAVMRKPGLSRANPYERRYHVVSVNEKTGEKTIVTREHEPVTHAEGVTIMNKFTRYPWRRIQLEEVATAPSPGYGHARGR